MLRPRLLLLPLIFIAFIHNASSRMSTEKLIEGAGERFYDGSTVKVPLDEAATNELHEHWTSQAVSGLMAAVATQRLTAASATARDRLATCSKTAQSITAHAACLVRFLDEAEEDKKSGVVKEDQPSFVLETDRKENEEVNEKAEEFLSRAGFVQKEKASEEGSGSFAFVTEAPREDELMEEEEKAIDFDTDDEPVEFVTKAPTSLDEDEEVEEEVEEEDVAKDEDIEWIGGFGQARYKRAVDDFRSFLPNFVTEAPASKAQKVISRATYTLPEESDSPFAAVARQLTKTVRALKNKKEPKSWRETIMRVRSVGEEDRKEQEKKKALRKHLKKLIENIPNKFDNPIRKDALEKMDEAEAQELERQKKLQKQLAEIRVPLKVVREAVKLGMMLAGQNTSNFDNKTLKLVSPRFMGVVSEDEDEDTVNLLSPSLFSVHDEGEGLEKLTSLPEILKGLKLQGEQDAWMDFILETSGVGDAVEKAAEERRKAKQREMSGKDGQPLYFDKKNVTDLGGMQEKHKVETFEALDKSLDQECIEDFVQKQELDSRGYSVLSEEQLKTLYGEDSPYHHPEVLEQFLNMTAHGTQEDFIEKNIRALATAKDVRVELRRMPSVRRHKRDIILSPVVLTWLVFASGTLSNTWIVLSPLVLSPIVLSPAVLGPIILSPWVFVPLILSPRVLGPLVLSPMIGSPIVLSPLVLHPLILTPGVMNPIILSPLVLSPLILSPQVFTPLVLSPMVLNPLILNPMVGSPLVLSPFVLSPLILSPQVLFAVVLSPYALSPLVESKLVAAEVILSPSWLS